MRVSTIEVTDTISKHKKGKACGPDGICAEACMFCFHCVFLYVCLMVIYHNL